MTVELRPVTPEDEEFLLQVYASARAEEMAQVPWSDSQREAFLRMQFAAQRSHYKQHNPTATHDLDITVLHAHRRQGIGTTLLKGLMEEAGRTRKPLNIYVEFYNPSYRLFERLGFLKVERADDDGLNHLLEWRA